MPSLAPETASLSRYRQHPWYARPIDEGLGPSSCCGWRSAVESTHNVESLLEGLRRLVEMVVLVL